MRLLCRVVRLPVSHDREDDVAQLPGNGGHGHPVGLALPALLVVEGLEPGVVLACAVRGEPERPSEVR